MVCFMFSNCSYSRILFVTNSGPREDATRIGSAGVGSRQAVDIPADILITIKDLQSDSRRQAVDIYNLNYCKSFILHTS